MAQTRKVLGQSYPTAATLTAAYTVPGATTATVSSISCCNQGAAQDTIRISVAVAGAADTSKQYVVYNLPLSAAGSSMNPYIATIGITLGAGDVVRVYSALGTTSFNIFGAEFT